MPVSCPFQGCKALLRIVKRRYIKYRAFAFAIWCSKHRIEYRNYSAWKVAVSFKIIYDDERNNTVFHSTTSDLQDQDQDHSIQDQDQDRFFGLRPVLS